MNAIAIHDLTKRFPGFTLENLTFDLPSGCIMGLIGENGAGKSTTIKLLLGMLRPDSGSIRVLGSDRPNLEDIGVVLEESGFPECLNAKKIGKIMSKIYRRWDGAEFFRLLEKLSVPIDKQYKDFSRGMKMKLAIAVALAHSPKLLILDEATSGLDPVVRDEVLDLFMEFTRREDHSILISSHIVSDLEKICDYISFIHNGKLMLLEEKDALYSRYGMVLCAKDDLDAIDPGAIRGKKESAYGVEAIVDREKIPYGMKTAPVSIENLFVFMAKEDTI